MKKRKLTFEEVAKIFQDTGAFSPITRKTEKQLLSQYPDIPNIVLRFLREIGHGFYDSEMALYPLYSATDIYDSNMERISDIVLYSCDYCGNYFGFDVANDWCHVVISAFGEVEDEDDEDEFLDNLRFHAHLIKKRISRKK